MSPNTLNSRMSNQGVDNNDEVAVMESVIKKPKHWYEFETKIKWQKSTLLLILHCASVYSSLTFPYRQHPFLCFWIWFVAFSSEVGVTCFAHRYWTHRSFKAAVPLRIFGAILFYTAGMNPIYYWARDHRLHHKYSDTEADPHDITRGFFFAHVGWLMLEKKPIVVQRGKGIDISDILEDPVARFFDKYNMILMPFFAIVLPVFLPVYFFNQDLKMTMISQLLIRYPYVLNVTFAVNSFAHMFGPRSYDKSIHPVENVWVSFLAAGEGWHNFHHAFPWDYRAAAHKSIFTNISAILLDIYRKMGLAYDFKTVSDEQMEKFIERKAEENRLMNAKSK